MKAHNPGGCIFCSCVKKHFIARDLPFVPNDHVLVPEPYMPSDLAVDLANHGYEIKSDFTLRRVGTDLQGLPQWLIGMKLHVQSEKIRDVNNPANYQTAVPGDFDYNPALARYNYDYEVDSIRQELHVLDATDTWLATAGMSIQYATHNTEKPFKITLDYTDGTVSREFDFFWRKGDPAVSSDKNLVRFSLPASDYYWYFPRLNLCRDVEGKLAIIASSAVNGSLSTAPRAYGFHIDPPSWINDVVNWEIAVVNVQPSSYVELTKWVLEEWYFAGAVNTEWTLSEDNTTYPYGKNKQELCLPCAPTITCRCSDLPSSVDIVADYWPSHPTSYTRPGPYTQTASYAVVGSESETNVARSEQCSYVSVVSRELAITFYTSPDVPTTATLQYTEEVTIIVVASSTGLTITYQYRLENILLCQAIWVVALDDGDACTDLMLVLYFADATITYPTGSMSEVGSGAWPTTVTEFVGLAASLTLQIV